MKKKTKKHQPFSKNKLSRFNQQKKNEPKDCYLGLGPKFVNSIVIGLNEDDDIHVKIERSRSGAGARNLKRKPDRQNR